MQMSARQVGSMGSHKGFIHKKLCAHYAWIFTHCPGKICNAQFFRARCILSQSALILSPSCQRGIDLLPPGRFHGTDPSQGPARPTQCTRSKHKSALTTAFGNIRAGQIVGKGEFLRMRRNGCRHRAMPGCGTHTYTLKKCVKYKPKNPQTKQTITDNNEPQKPHLIRESAARDARICSEKILVSRKRSDWKSLCLCPFSGACLGPLWGTSVTQSFLLLSPLSLSCSPGEYRVARFSKQKYSMYSEI